MSSTCKAIFCGGRNYDNNKAIREVLIELSLNYTRVVVITGGAPGADMIAHYEAGKLGLDTMVINAEWSFYGASAGPRRNAEMIAELLEPVGEETDRFVYAFGGGRGTNDTIKKARAAGVKVVQIA